MDLENSMQGEDNGNVIHQRERRGRGEGLLSVRNRYIIVYMAEGFKFKLI